MKLARFAGVFACAVAAVTVVVTVLSLVLSARADELTGLARQVYPETGFAGAPVLDGISPDVDLGFLDEDPTLPRSASSARAGMDSGICRKELPSSFTARATIVLTSGSTARW